MNTRAFFNKVLGLKCCRFLTLAVIFEYQLVNKFDEVGLDVGDEDWMALDESFVILTAPLVPPAGSLVCLLKSILHNSASFKFSFSWVKSYKRYLYKCNFDFFRCKFSYQGPTFTCLQYFTPLRAPSFFLFFLFFKLKLILLILYFTCY